MVANELKIISDAGASLRLGGYAVVFGGRDVVGDYFTASTDFWFSKVTENPMVLFQHGQDPMLKRTVVGRVVTKVPDDIGLWVEAQITASKQYADAIRELVHKGVLGWSSGSVPHLVQRVKGTLPGTNEITSWPIVELSLTPTPAEPRTIGVKELKSLAQLDPLLTVVAEEAEEHEPEAKATLTSSARNNLSSSDFAYVDSDGGKHLPINDEAHVRAAMSRFNQTHFESTEKKRAAARKILARARSMGIDVTADSAVAAAAKGVSMNDLPDDAFGYVEPGTLDDDKKTFPRANRHFAHHDAEGNVDPELLAVAILEAKQHLLGSHALSHLLRHESNVQAGRVDDAHMKFWAEDAIPARWLLIGKRICELAETVATQQKAMDLLGNYQSVVKRVLPEQTQEAEELIALFTASVDHAKQAEQGDDGTARAEYLRRRLALLEV